MSPRTKKPKEKDGTDHLRGKAEQRLDKQPAGSSLMGSETSEKLIHELRVHQIELEMQNEALREARLSLEESRDKYLDLYEFAPVGYLTLTRNAVIEEVNLTGAALLGVDRRTLIRDRFRRFIIPEDLERWDRLFLSVLHTAEKQTCDLHLLKSDCSPFSARVESLIIRREHKDPVIRVAISDITEQKRAEEQMKIFRTFTENAQDIILFIRKSDGKIIEANRKATEVYGFSHDELLGMTGFVLRAYDSRELVERQMAEADTTGILFETIHRRKDGSDLPVEVKSFSLQFNGEPVIFSIVRDITERKRADIFRQLSVKVIEILNEPAEFREVVQRVLDAIKNATKADAVGIRLTVGDDFPYFVQEGFSRDFLLKENTLVVGDQDHQICRDSQGNVSLECTCGQVISGKTDPKNPFFTPGGSFWTNNSVPQLNPAERDDPRFHPHNACIHKGFASVAIIPIRKNPKQVIGTLQINAFTKNFFTPDIIQSLELIAGQVGEALMRKHAEEEVYRLSEDRKTLIDNVPAMIWYKDTCNNFIRVNPAGARTYGMPVGAVEGKSAYDLFPEDAKDYYRDDLEVISSGKPKFGIIQPMKTSSGKNLWIRTDKIPLKGKNGTINGVLVFAVDITDIKLAEEELISRSNQIHESNIELTAAGDELREKEMKLTASLEEKEALLAEVHHRVKNNLAAFISLLSLEGTYEDTPAGDQLKKDLQNRARSMALIHETLYMTRNFSSVDMGVYLKTLAEQVAATYSSERSIRTIVQSEGITLDLARATPCGLIVNELITNSMKYAFPASFDCAAVRHDPCTIRVSMTKTAGMNELIIRDNGIGLPPDFDPKTAKSLGLKLVNFLAKHQLRAKIGIETHDGTEFVFRFEE
jgi:PAS domain S-box-containing protein